MAAHGLQGGKTGNKLHDDEQHGDPRADDPRNLNPPVSFHFRNLVRGGGSISESDNRAERGEVDKPVERIASQQGKEDGKHHDKHDAERGFGEFLREDAVLRHRGQDTCRGAIAPDDSRQDGRNGGDGHDRKAGFSHDGFRRIKRGDGGHPAHTVQGSEVFLPGRESVRDGSNADDCHGRIRERSHNDRRDKNPAGLFHREAEVCRVKACDFKTHESPGRQNDQAENRIPAADRSASEGCQGPVLQGRGEAENRDDRNPRGKHDRQHRKNPLKGRLCRHKEHADSGQDQHRNDCFPEIDGVSGDGIVESALGRAAEKDADDEKHGRAVEENNRQVGQAQEPGTEKGMIPSERFLGIGIDSAGDGTASHQVREVTGNHQHDDHADRHGNHGPCRSRDREEGVAGHGKHAPADHAAEGHPPHVQFGQVAVQGFRWRKLVHIASHHAESVLHALK